MSLSWAKDGGALANMRTDAHLSDRVTEIASFPCTQLNRHGGETVIAQSHPFLRYLIGLLYDFAIRCNAYSIDKVVRMELFVYYVDIHFYGID